MSPSKTPRKILVINDWGGSYFKPFKYLGLECTNDPKELYKDPKSIALVVFTGGEDVSPGLYDRSKHSTTCNSFKRDIEEIDVFKSAEAAEIPLAGICRGSQFLCVMAGGRLVQDITGHAGGTHDLVCRKRGDNEPTIIQVTSSHHQLQYPFDMDEGDDYELIGVNPKPRSKHYAFDAETTILAEEANEDLLKEPDIVWYPHIKALAAQYHPEWMEETSNGFLYYRELIDAYLVPLMEEHDQLRKGTS